MQYTAPTTYPTIPGISFTEGSVSSLWYYLHQLPDRRGIQGRRHELPVILTLAILAICSGRKTYEDIALWTQDYQDELRSQLPFLACHTPDPSTFFRVFRDLDCVAFEVVVSAWVSVFAPSLPGDGIAIDGKTTAGDSVHAVAAFAHRLKSVLFQEVTDTKGKEIPVGQDVLSHIPVSNRVITADALHAQKTICREITSRGGGYVICAKGNQEDLKDVIRTFFTKPPWNAAMTRYETQEKSHGRWEERLIELSDDPGIITYARWPGLTHVFRITRKRTRNGREETETVVGIARLLPGRSTAKDAYEYLRNHWRIENNLHRQRDVVFGEDHSTIRKRHAPQTMMILRNIVTTMFYRLSDQPFVRTMQRFAARPEILFRALELPTCARLYL